MTSTFNSLFNPSEDEETDLRRILSRVAREYGLSLADLRSEAKLRPHALARRAGALAAREAGFGPTEIARCMRKESSSVYDMLRTAEAETEAERKAKLAKAIGAPLAAQSRVNDSAPWETFAREQDKKFIEHMRKALESGDV